LAHSRSGRSLSSSELSPLKQPLDAEVFIADLKHKLKAALEALDRDLPTNVHVKITDREGGWIKLSPLEAQAEPVHLARLKAEISQRWPMISLLDILKEADLRVHFTDHFQTATGYTRLDAAALQKRLLLCFYGLGTNIGLKRVCAGDHGENYRDVLYTRRRFITRADLRAATTAVANAIFSIRQPQIWGEGTTACASDSKKFGAWDQNLMTEWHARYRGPGIMIYWHVERKAVCIYSQLKSCSSSEVAAMITGVLRHCTEMSVERQYVDTHGQSEVAANLRFDRLLYVVGFSTSAPAQRDSPAKAVPAGGQIRLPQPGIGAGPSDQMEADRTAL
jgi:hypothetical protein